MQEKSIGGSRYFLLFKDDFSHYRIVFFLKEKSEVKKIIETYIKSVKRDTDCALKILRTDNGLEFVNNDVSEMLLNHRVRHQTCVPDTSQQNGSA